MILMLKKCKTFREQVINDKIEFESYHTIVKYTNTMLKIYFNDYSRIC